MGYCTDQHGRLCCDFCGQSGGVKRRRCPFGYCQSVACCTRQECRDKLKDYRKKHCRTSCKKGHAEFVAMQEEKQRLLQAGKWLRRAAWNWGKCVKVMFHNLHGHDLEVDMAKQTYDAFPLLTNVTLEQYKEVGRVEAEPFDADEAVPCGFSP